MSDITGTPLPKAVDPANRVTDRAGSVSKDPARSETQAKERHGDGSTKNDRSDALHGRDPAVSISASVAHLEIGERLKEQVNKVDLEGRPIIVTETATYALRPDAGLRSGDDVELEIVEAGKKVFADLFMKNGRLIDPPIRLALVVIAIHAREGEAIAPQTQAQGGKAYSNYSRSNSAPEDPEALAKLIGARASMLPSATNNPTPYAAQTPFAPPSAQVLQSQVADNPDRIGARSNSSDLATLIDAQQGQAPRTAKYQSSTPQATLMPGANAPNSAHFIPQSPLTAIPSEVASSAAGLGPALQAFTFEGAAPRTLQLMDPAVSRVNPAEVATVQTVQPLAPDMAKTLPMSVAQLAGSGAPLAKVETSLGAFVMPLAAASNLSGEQVRVSQPDTAQTPPARPSTSTPDAAGFKARLIPGGQKAPHNIIMNVIGDPAQPDPTKQQVTVKAVHIARAFLGADGPRADLRIETTAGLVTVTLPNAMRPAIGALLELTPAAVAENAPLPASIAYASIPMAPTAAVVPEAAAMTALSHQAWPALHESMALLAAQDPAAMGSLASRSADGGGKLANSLLFFLAAAGRGNPEGWIGEEATKALERHNRSLLDMLKQDVAQLMTRATDGAAEWRQVLLPLDARAADMPLIAMLFGHGPHVDPDRDHAGHGGEQDHDKEDLKRFILEVQFSILGPVQLDGVIRGQKFDLTLRTAATLPSGLRHDAIRLFDDALAASAFTGQLVIQEQTTFPLDVAAIMAGGKA